MEIGWYLRFTRGGAIEALIDAGQLAQIEHAMLVVPGWTLDATEQDGHLRIVLHQETTTREDQGATP